MLPAKPGMQTVQAATDVLPVTAPVVVKAVGHAAQLVEFRVSEYVPAAHAAHVTVPEPAAKLPNGHDVQFEASGGEKDPAAQRAQPTAPSVPRLVTLPKKPGAQIVQLETDELPGSSDEIPVGQGTQLAAPAADE